MKTLKYLFIHLTVRDGEREHDHRILHTTICDDVDFAAEYYAAHFWGAADRVDDSWCAWGGEIVITLEKVTEVSKEQYDYLWNLFY